MDFSGPYTGDSADSLHTLCATNLLWNMAQLEEEASALERIQASVVTSMYSLCSLVNPKLPLLKEPDWPTLRW